MLDQWKKVIFCKLRQFSTYIVIMYIMFEIGFIKVAISIEKRYLYRQIDDSI